MYPAVNRFGCRVKMRRLTTKRSAMVMARKIARVVQRKRSA
jgi:hypothetical protein